LAITDSLKEFWLKKILLPKVFRIDIPGYVIGKFYTLQGQSVFVRNLFLSEPFFVYLEREVSEEQGSVGLSKLYGVGKRFGYRFAELNRLPKSEIESSATLAFKFIESLYAESISLSIDLNVKSLTLDTVDLVVTRLNGSGLPLTVGGSAGIWSYFLGDFDNIECGVRRSLGGNRYLLVSAPEDVLKSQGMEFYRSRGRPKAEGKDYARFNSPPQGIPRQSYDINRLMQANLFNYRKGSLKFALPDVRFVPVELSLPYELESAVGDDIVYKAAKESFRQVGIGLSRQADSYLFLSNMLTALGYGLSGIEKDADVRTLNLTGFPWYRTSGTSTFPIVRGAVEGFLEGQAGRTVRIAEVKSRVSDNSLKISVVIVG
jgi:hypothetical protein